MTPPRKGAEGFITAERQHLDAFANIRLVTETVAEGDRVVAYVVFEGDQVKELFGISPAGAHLRMSMCNIFRITDGKIIEKRAHYDRLDHMEQLRSKAKG
ncbi:ester cyclase [Arthrobacter sp. Marseille-P9274]|uniref:ester cyclase n=1 Tax=Arthrobacter sp. Marseille-P9274 TaxID=2866572 RepID=UPI0021C86724|nr:ester cyclase [Arthrobacter sp. Marseille-P9274]